MSKADDPRVSTTGGVVAGFEEGSVPGPVKDNGQHESYWILSDEERAKGWVRPLRFKYVRVGPEPPKYALRPLTEEELERHGEYGYVAKEDYPEDPNSSISGRFWTQAHIDAVKVGGCGTETRMSQKIAETYARQPDFYGATFCCGCGTHLPVSHFEWSDKSGRVGS
jgi:hypothetical protein